MVSKETEFLPSGQIIIFGEDFRCFGKKSKAAGNLARPGFYLVPKGLPSLQKGAKEEKGFGLFDVAFLHLDPERVKGEQPSVGFTIRVLEEADQSELVFTGIPEVWRRPNGTYLVQFRKFQDAAGQKGALLLPFKRNDQGNLTRLLLQIRGKFESLV